MLIEQTIELKLKGPGPPNGICTSTIGYFHDMTIQKSLRNIIESSILLYDAKILQEAISLTTPYLGQITYYA